MTWVPIRNLGQYGVLKDQAAYELPDNALTDAKNFRFVNGYAERVKGHIQLSNTPAVTPYFVSPLRTSATRFVLHAGTAAAYVDDGTTLTDITGTPFTGGIDDRHVGASFSGNYIITNGVDVPQYWTGSTAANFATLTGWDTTYRCKSILGFGAYLVALGISISGTSYPHMYKWSGQGTAGAIPTTWDHTDPATLAGETDIAESSDLIVDGAPLGDLIVVYKEQSTWAIRNVGGDKVLDHFRLKGDSGLLARGCIGRTPRGHVLLVPGDVVIHDGMSEPVSILDDAMRRYLTLNIDSTYYARSFVVSNPKFKEVWICFPEVGYDVCTKAIVWSWKTGSLGLRDLPNATYGASGLVPESAGSTIDELVGSIDGLDGAIDAREDNPSESRLVLATTSPSILLADSGQTFLGSDFTAYIERTGLTFGDMSRTKEVRGVRLDVDADEGTQLTIRLASAMKSNAAPTWTADRTYTVGEDDAVDIITSGKLIGYHIESTSSNAWRVKSIAFDVRAGGWF